MALAKILVEVDPERIILSPGPKSPKEAGVCMDVVKEFTGKSRLWESVWGISALEKPLVEPPVVGLQFYPESIYTEHGKRIIENFVNGTM